jgi:hypothetical protein
MTVMRVRASMGESTRIRLVWDRIGHAAAKGLTERPWKTRALRCRFRTFRNSFIQKGFNTVAPWRKQLRRRLR